MSSDTRTLSTIPANDPQTRRWLPTGSTPLDPGRVQSLLAAEWERFTATTPGSAAAQARAAKSLPLGVPSSFQWWDPYPISVESAKGAWLIDSDGRRVLDLSMGFGAMLVGHLNPVVVDAVKRQLETGTLFVTPSPSATTVAELEALVGGQVGSSEPAPWGTASRTTLVSLDDGRRLAVARRHGRRALPGRLDRLGARVRRA